MINWDVYTKDIVSCLEQLSVSDRSGRKIDTDRALYILTYLTLMAKDKSRTMFFVGNGGSAAMASHVAADIGNNAEIRTETFTDLSLITAIANDFSYEQVFVKPLLKKMSQGDILVAISSSGNSPNVVNAAKKALNLGGTVVTLSAMNPDNKLRTIGNLNFYLPASTYGLAETCHAVILHCWTDSVIKNKENDNVRDFEVYTNFFSEAGNL